MGFNILIAPDKFKGSLTAGQVCEAVESGIARFDPALKVTKHPLADGGEGTLDILETSLELERVYREVNDPLFRPVEAYYLKDQQTAFIEMASASGLHRLRKEERDPLKTTTYGTGELILDAIQRGVRSIYLFIGGSATNDAGTGMAKALGYAYYDADQNPVRPIGENLSRITTITRPQPGIPISDVQFTVVCDVKNPLFGPEGAAYTYALQKGGNRDSVKTLDLGLVNISRVLKNGFEYKEGAGAAGGLGYGALSFLAATLRPGIETIMQLTAFQHKLDDADLVITGEGKLDRQTLHGKVIAGVAQEARARKVPVSAICGMAEDETLIIRKLGLRAIWQVRSVARNLQDSMSNAFDHVEHLAYTLAQQIETS